VGRTAPTWANGPWSGGNGGLARGPEATFAAVSPHGAHTAATAAGWAPWAVCPAGGRVANTAQTGRPRRAGRAFLGRGVRPRASTASGPNEKRPSGWGPVATTSRSSRGSVAILGRWPNDLRCWPPTGRRQPGDCGGQLHQRVALVGGEKGECPAPGPRWANQPTATGPAIMRSGPLKVLIWQPGPRQKRHVAAFA
jgi:hypothetical protein